MIAMSDASEGDTGIRGHVKRWLANHGVMLEMKVAGKFREALRETNHPHDVDLGRSYLDHDPQTRLAKLRETDVVVRATKTTFGRIWFSVWLAIECKSGTSEPWVFYRSAGRAEPWPQTIDETAFDFVVDNRLARDNLGGFSQSQLLTATTNNCYAAASVKGTGSETNPANAARSAIMQAQSAAQGVRRDIPTERQPQPTAAVVIPVVVTAAPMFAVALTTGSDYALMETNREVVQVRVPDDDRIRKVWVVHESDLDQFVADFLSLVNELEYRT